MKNKSLIAYCNKKFSIIKKTHFSLTFMILKDTI